ncbi:phage portal protein [Petroclostridium sp. X23]|uniref:phage portal protein n=1 Tax=Petroclostridium sp. X23 TaxID=3045146 RepID=UPI0024AE2560|nr:phage portal protein [Petroclostridium sp. X23]WHH59157.1 phage portal protein [Petroclostridium sp. X23]
MTNRVIVKKITSESNIVRESRQIQDDPFKDMYGNGIIEPPYDPELLIRLPETSDILQQCIDAYKTNIAGFGISFKYDVDYDKEKDAGKKKEYEVQWSRYENFFKYCNFDEAFIEVLQKAIEDREKIGWGGIEVIPDGVGKPAGFEHIPGHTFRLCKKDTKLVDIKTTITDEYGKEVEITRKRRFKKFVQLQGTKKVYFKEFGDPRQLNCETGEYGENVPEDKQATSIMFFNVYCAYSDYGLPRYIGQLLNIQGNRKAEELNYRYFEEGRHIPLAIVVENGQLTEGSIAQLKDSKGESAQYKYLVLEAEGFNDESSITGLDDDKKQKVAIKFEKLAEIMNDDALFQNYCKNNRDKIRSAFRLHPIYTGESQDYTRATADTARQITEEQVFQPERESLAFMFNNLLKDPLEVNAVSMFFKAPKITDRAELSRALTPFIQAGTATANNLIDALGELLGKDFEQITEDWANKPLQMVLKEMELQKVEQAVPVQKSAEDRQLIIEVLKELRETVEEALGSDQ